MTNIMTKNRFLLAFLLMGITTGYASRTSGTSATSHETETRWLLRGGQSCITDEDCPQHPCDKEEEEDEEEEDCPPPFVCDKNGKCKQTKKKTKTNNKDDKKEENHPKKEQAVLLEKNGEEEEEEDGEEISDLLPLATEMPSATEFPTTLEDTATMEVTALPSEEAEDVETAECSIDSDCLNKKVECIEGTCTLIRQDRICGPTICPEDQTCCNSSCGVCTSPGMSCFKEICEPKKKKYMKCDVDSDCRNSDEICEDGKCVAVTVLDPVPMEDRECYEDVNCPPLDCITAPCPQYRCIDYACVLEDDV